MPQRNKIGILAGLIVFILQLNLQAAWWDNAGIPVPPNTKQEKQETRRIAGAEYNFTYYSSQSSLQELKDFYRHRLAAAGWNEQQLGKQIDRAQLPNSGLNADYLKQALEANLIFQKEKDTLIINFIPEKFSEEGKVKFTVCLGKIEESSLTSIKETPFPELVAKPKKDVFAVYPGASLINLNEACASLKANYFTKDDIDKVANFYDAKMADYGWSKESEKPIETSAMQGAPCPTCPKTSDNMKDFEVLGLQMYFVNAKGDRCTIGIGQVKQKQAGSDSLGNITTIGVDYNEKAK